jgi:hypothetical protein
MHSQTEQIAIFAGNKDFGGAVPIEIGQDRASQAAVRNVDLPQDLATALDLFERVE